MTTNGREGDWKLWAALAALCACLLGGTWLLGNATIERLLRKDAETTGTLWARDFAARLPDLGPILAGARPSAESREFMLAARELGQVFRFKLFDAQGRQVLVSDAIDQALPPERLSEHNPQAAAVLATKEPHSVLKTGTPPQRPAWYVETYVPLVVDGRLRAVSEVYVDQTVKHAVYSSHMAYATLGLVGLTALAFGLPAAGFVWRTRQKQRADARVTFLAHYDPMTGLLNRASFMEALQAALRDSRSAGAGLAVHFVDVDRFKDINDTLGHDIGDEVVRQLAGRLHRAGGDDALVARLGGDEFALLQHRVDSGAGALAFAQRVIDAVAQPCQARGHDIAATASVGVLWIPADEAGKAPDAVDALKRADIAMYQAKSQGRNRACLFDPSMDSELQSRRRLERRIREALAGDAFEVHFQPLYGAADRELTGFEALLRLDGDDGQPIPPATFIPVAEDMGLISAIGARVLERACLAATGWPRQLKIAVNLSPAQFAAGSIVETVRLALERSTLAPQRLELEITEGLLLQQTEAVMRDLSELKALGVSIVMDDFGTGYSSLAYLWRFPFDKIKIDRSFVGALSAGDPTVLNIVRTIVSLGQSLRMTVTAEGVETRDQADYLAALACDQLQGYLLGRPVPEAGVGPIIAGDVPAPPTRAQAQALATVRATGAPPVPAAPAPVTLPR